MSEKNTLQDKNKAIELALSQIEKQFGKGAIMRLGNDAAAAGCGGHLHRFYLP